MTKDENLLVTLSEECAEIQQAVSKSLRFGTNNYNPATPKLTNERDIMVEYYHLVTVMEILTERGTLHQLKCDDIARIKNNKRRNVERYQNLSSELGLIK